MKIAIIKKLSINIFILIFLFIFLSSCTLMPIKKGKTIDEFETGSKWHSSNPKLTFNVTKNGSFATLIIDGKKLEFDFYGCDGALFLTYVTEEGICAFASGHYKLTPNGDMIIKNFESDHEDFDFYYEKIVLEKEKTGDEEKT